MDKSTNTPTTAAGYNIPKATVGVDGYLSNTDFTTFNNKQAGSTELNNVALLSTIGFVKRTPANTYSTVASIELTNSVTGTLPVANGGTGLATLTSGSLLVGNGTTGPTFLTATATNNVIYATSSTAWASGTPDTADLVAKSGAQTITGLKTIQPAAAGTVGVIFQGASGQTADLQQWKNFAGTVLAYIGAAGDFVISTDNLVITSTNAVDAAACTTVGSIARDSAGDLYICK